MLVVLPEGANGRLPQTPQFTHWFPATFEILMSGFTGEPIELELDPALLEPLAPWQKLNFGAFLGLCVPRLRGNPPGKHSPRFSLSPLCSPWTVRRYVLYIFLSLILLLNLLIALLGSTFNKTREDATLQVQSPLIISHNLPISHPESS